MCLMGILCRSDHFAAYRSKICEAGRARPQSFLQLSLAVHLNAVLFQRNAEALLIARWWRSLGKAAPTGSGDIWLQVWFDCKQQPLREVKMPPTSWLCDFYHFLPADGRIYSNGRD